VTTAAAIDFEHVTKRYGTGPAAATAVDDLTLHVPAGSVCVLVGPSGCGKTTTLKMVNRLVEPTSGRVLVAGADVAEGDPAQLRRGIGYVIQQVGLFPHRTIAENVATVPSLLGWPEARRRARAEELLHLVGLDPARHAGRYPDALSGGERQRVGVARALAADPPVLLMDEPFGAVDPIVRERLQDELLALQERLSKTILLVTHDIDEAIKMGDLVAVLEVGGRLAQVGPPAGILAAPASDFVARFVGTDRGLKRLSLERVASLALATPVTARVGDPAAEAAARLAAAGEAYLLVLDGGDRPVGWIHAAALGDGPVSSDRATAVTPRLDLRATLRDTLSLLLDAGVQAGVVLDDAGRLLGIVTAEAIAERLRRPVAAADVPEPS
jgi:osmoprotectant transport system ATP-binding protein